MARPKKTAESTTATKKTTTRKKAEETKVEAPVEEQVNQVLEETTQEKVTETETPKPIGNLFGSINYNQTSDLDNFITNMTPDQGLYILVQAARAAHSRNAYTMEESETLSKAIRMITKPADTPTEQPVEEVTE